MTAKKRLLPILVAVLMVFAMMPITAGTVFADADLTPPQIDGSTLKAVISSGGDTATVGDIVTVSVNITDDTAVGSVYIYISRPSGGLIGDDMEYNPESGCYEYVLSVNESTVPGEYTINQITAYDTSDNPAYLNHPASGNFTVENPDADATPPQIDGSTLKAVISSGGDTATVGDIVTVSVNITDDTAVGSVYIYISRPSGGLIGDDMEYNPESGCYEYVLSVNESTVPGEYTINQITAYDTSDNPAYLNHPASGSFTVENPDADATPPVIDLSTLKAEISSGEETAKVGDTVTVSAKITDDTSVGSVYIYISRPSGGSIGDNMQYNAESGRYEYVMAVTESTVPGEYTINQITATDTSGNPAHLNHPSSGSFIVSGTTSDGTPPVIDTGSLQLTLPAGMEFAVTGKAVTAGVAVSDEGLGVSRVTIRYSMPVSGDKDSFQLTYNAETGKWENAIVFNKSSERGTWKIYSIEALDRGGNLTRIINSEFDTDPGADLSAGDFLLGSTVTFDTRGGNGIDPQYVIPGGYASRPEPQPYKDGFSFGGWYIDEALARSFSFYDPVNEDITLYAKWDALLGFNSYDATNEVESAGGRFSITEGEYEDEPIYGWMFSTMELGWERVLKAYPDKGYKFKGWYEGKVENIYKDGKLYSQTIIPQDLNDPSTLISTETTLPITAERDRCYCAVFEKCTDHQWEEKIQKATPDAEGRIYGVCSICGAENTEDGIIPLPKVSNIKLAKTSYTYTGKAITPKVTVANAGEELSADVYDVRYSNNTNVGTATVKVTLKGDYYEGTKSLTFKINKAANPLTIKPKTATVKYSKLKKKTQTLAVTKVIKFTKQLKDKKTYTLSSAKKGKKSFKKYFKVNKTTGKVTVKKGLKKGTYNVKVKVKAAGNANYKESAVKTVTFKVRVK